MTNNLADLNAPNKHIAELTHLSMGYASIPILEDLNLQFEANKTYAIIGASGCGKTTLLYAIAGLLSPSSGQIVINGQSTMEAHAETAIVLQEYGLFPWKSVWENLVLGLTLKNTLMNEKTKQAKALANQLGLSAHLDKYPAQLSGGQKQRVAIGRSWLLEPNLLLMDEPFSSLDALTREELQDMVIDLYREKPTSMILVTHSIEEAVYLGQHILLMAPKGGKILNVYDNPNFGLCNHRETDEFYHICQKIRHDLRGA